MLQARRRRLALHEVHQLRHSHDTDTAVLLEPQEMSVTADDVIGSRCHPAFQYPVIGVVATYNRKPPLRIGIDRRGLFGDCVFVCLPRTFTHLDEVMLLST